MAKYEIIIEVESDSIEKAILDFFKEHKDLKDNFKGCHKVNNNLDINKKLEQYLLLESLNHLYIKTVKEMELIDIDTNKYVKEDDISDNNSIINKVRNRIVIKKDKY